MPRKKPNYKIGDVFILPLDDIGNYGVGRILLAKSPLLFVEFYKIVIREKTDIAAIEKEKVFYRKNCSDMGFKNNEWQVIGNIPLEEQYDPTADYWWINILGKYYLRKYSILDKKLCLSQFKDTLSTEDEIKTLNAQPDGAAGSDHARWSLKIALEKEGVYRITDKIKTIE